MDSPPVNVKKGVKSQVKTRTNFVLARTWPGISKVVTTPELKTKKGEFMLNILEIRDNRRYFLSYKVGKLTKLFSATFACKICIQQ